MAAIWNAGYSEGQIRLAVRGTVGVDLDPAFTTASTRESGFRHTGSHHDCLDWISDGTGQNGKYNVPVGATVLGADDLEGLH